LSTELCSLAPTGSHVKLTS